MPHPSSTYAIVPSIGADGVGKTTLARALAELLRRRNAASVSPPRRVEVNRLSSTVFEFFTTRRYYQYLDFESHRVEQSLIGSMPFAGAILVVSAKDSVMSQTRDSVMHAREAGVPRIIPVLSRCDEVADAEMLDLIALEIDELLTKFEFRCEIQAVRTAALPALHGDEQWLSRLGSLVDALDATITA